jgi:glycine/D-amino acid oxidase-like deaminating enzyme
LKGWLKSVEQEYSGFDEGEETMIDLPPNPLSLWMDVNEEYTFAQELEGDRKCDIAVIGGGFAGLSAAYAVRCAEPALQVALLEARTVAYGASGRNGSFAMTVVGLGFSVTAMIRGRGFLKTAHTYMERAVDTLDELILTENLDCRRIRPGFLRVATTPAYQRKLQEEVELMKSLGFNGIEWLDEAETRSRVNSDRYLGAMWEPRLLLIDPVLLAREQKRLAQEVGVAVYEHSPVIEISAGPPYSLRTPRGTLTAGKIVYAANAYSHSFPALKRKQIPAFTYMIATEPLTPEQLAPIGWKNMEGLEDARNLIHYYRLTPDQRIVLGGGPVGLTWGNSLRGDENPSAWAHLERHLRFLFPHLEDVRISHRWGGPFSVTPTLTPVLGRTKDASAVYSIGCIGHGVSMSYLNGLTLRDLILERKTELTDGPFVSRRTIPWPPEPLRSAAAWALRGYLALEESWYERGLKQ